jgi:DNA-binding response OmpR family regulator
LRTWRPQRTFLDIADPTAAIGRAPAVQNSLDRDAGTRQPDLVILDLGLPDDEGVGFITEMKRAGMSN